MLQEQSQNEKKKEENIKNSKKYANKNNKRKCLWQKMYDFKQCSCICKTIWFFDWKKNKKICNEMRQRLKTIDAYKIIQKLTNTNILNEIIDEMIKKRQQKPNNLQSNKKRQNKSQKNNKDKFRLKNMCEAIRLLEVP